MDNSQFQTLSDVAPQGQPAVGVPAAPQQRLYTADQVEKMMEPKKDAAGLVKTIVIIFLALVSAAFIGLFIWMMSQYHEAQSDLDDKIAVAVAEANYEQAKKDEADFAEREKEPNRSFSGPDDYGGLSFKYPKTWSLYVAEDASNGGNYVAYFNPIQIDPLARESINALNLTIRNQSFESVVDSYKREVEGKEPAMTVETITVNGATANRYVGKIPGTEHNGIVVVIKIRDKTVILQTDSMLFESDFNALVDTVGFNA